MSIDKSQSAKQTMSQNVDACIQGCYNKTMSQLEGSTGEVSITNLLSCILISCLGIFLMLYFHNMWIQSFQKTNNETSTLNTTNSNVNSTNSGRVSLGTMQLYFGTLECLGMYVCLIISLHYNYNSDTATECVDHPPEDFPTNYVPSISACIGNHFPQVFIWRVSLMVSEFYRWGSAITFYLHHQHILRKNKTHQAINKARLAVSFIETAGNIGLSACSSTDSDTAHEIFFAFYAISCIIMMLLSIVLTKRKLKVQTKNMNNNSTGSGNNIKPLTTTTVTKSIETEQKRSLRYTKISLKKRKLVATFNVFSLVCAMFFFITGQGSMCTVNGWYSMFALCEWCYVFSGAAFKYIDAIELRDVTLCFDMDSLMQKDHPI